MNVIHKSLSSDIYELKSTRNNITMPYKTIIPTLEKVKVYEIYINNGKDLLEIGYEISYVEYHLKLLLKSNKI